MATQTFLTLTELGKPLAKTSVPVPEPKENELLIKITVTGLNPIDVASRDRDIFGFYSRLPATVGYDIVGNVTKNGPNTSFPLGARVFSQAIGGIPSTDNLPTAGGLQEYTVVDSRYTAIVPPGISDDDAAVFPVNGMTIAYSLFSTAGFGRPLPGTPESKDYDYASQKLVVLGGGTNTGKLAVQFARLAGISAIIAVASLSGEGELRSYGATHVIARQAPDIEAQVQQIVGDELVYVIDCSPAGSGSHNLAVSLLSTSKRGMFVHLIPGQVDAAIVAQKKVGFDDKPVRGWSNVIPEFGKLFWKQFPNWLETGKVKPVKYTVIEGLDVDKVNAALDELKEQKGGRWHVHLA